VAAGRWGLTQSAGRSIPAGLFNVRGVRHDSASIRLGLLACSGYHPRRLWFPFLLGWAAKVGIMRLAGARMLKQARRYFVAVIIVEFFLNGVSAIVSAISGGKVPGI